MRKAVTKGDSHPHDPSPPYAPPRIPQAKPRVRTTGPVELWKGATPSEQEVRHQIAEARIQLDDTLGRFEKLAAWLMQIDFDRGVVLANQIKTLRTEVVKMKLEGV